LECKSHSNELFGVAIAKIFLPNFPHAMVSSALLTGKIMLSKKRNEMGDGSPFELPIYLKRKERIKPAESQYCICWTL
jgi:hypothetical protein